MPERFQFSPDILNVVVGGQSVVDMPRLNFKTPLEAESFIQGYGFDLHRPEDEKKLWYFHRRALVLLEEKLGFKAEEIPEEIRDAKKLSDLRRLLLWASSGREEDRVLQRWSCAVLRVMHAYVHIENDLFSSFSEEIQRQILSHFQECIFHDGTTGLTYLRSPKGKHSHDQSVPLLGFEVKPFKTSSSSVIKLLAKSDLQAMNLLDRLGLRFVTSSMFDSFRVIRFLVQEGLVSFPHIMTDQSSNNLYPVGLFCEVAQKLAELPHHPNDVEIDQIFREHYEQRKDQVQFLRKQNNFSGADYQFIKFISRKLIRLHPHGAKESFSFFFPFEIQIMDQSAHQKILSGPSEHQAYKERQRQGARQRVMPESVS